MTPKPNKGISDNQIRIDNVFKKIDSRTKETMASDFQKTSLDQEDIDSFFEKSSQRSHQDHQETSPKKHKIEMKEEIDILDDLFTSQSPKKKIKLPTIPHKSIIFDDDDDYDDDDDNDDENDDDNDDDKDDDNDKDVGNEDMKKTNEENIVSQPKECISNFFDLEKNERENKFPKEKNNPPPISTHPLPVQLVQLVQPVEQPKVVATSFTAKKKAKVGNKIGCIWLDDEFDPALVGWGKDQPVPYVYLCQVYSSIEENSGRLDKIKILSNFFRSVLLLTPEDLLPCIYLTINSTGPVWDSNELGIGESLILKAIADSCGRTQSVLKKELEKLGDLGEVALCSKASQQLLFTPPILEIRSLFKTMQAISKMTGNQSQTKKVNIIKQLLIGCREKEALYTVRMLQGKFRIGFAEKSLFSALALALTRVHVEPSDDEEFMAARDRVANTIKNAFYQVPDWSRIIPIFLTLTPDTIHLLEQKCSISPGIPLKPMLAHPTKGIEDVLTRFVGKDYTAEYKYDGERTQIHYAGPEKIFIFSRNLENTTDKFPDIIEHVKMAVKPEIESFIIDCEAVGINKETNKFLPFQQLSTRKKKDVKLSEIAIPICVTAFDLLYLNGKSFLGTSFEERRNLLKESFNSVPQKFSFAEYRNPSGSEDIEEFLNMAIDHQCEGLMLKTLGEGSSYEPSNRSFNWLKVKKDYLQGLSDSVDLVPIAAWFGKGKRTGVYGTYLLACIDEDGEHYQTVCKIGSGFSDQDLENHHTFFKTKEIPSKKNYYHITDAFKSPDVWFEPSQVWEVKGADLTISPNHTAAFGLVDPSKGISLRFPRFLRIRQDKSIENATNAYQITELYNNQKLNMA